MKPRGSKGKVANNLLSLSSAAVLAVYAAGYVRTQPAAEAFEKEGARRRPVVPITRRRVTPAAQPKVPVAAAVAAAAIVSAPSPEAREFSRTPETPRTDAAPALPSEPVISRETLPTQSSTPSPQVAAPEPQVATSAPAPTPVFVPQPAKAAPASPSSAMAAFLAASDAAAKAAAAPRPKWRDGVFFGWGYSPHGDILARVEIDNGRIVSAAISECKTRYSCSDINHLPPLVVERQRADVDRVSGATESADAFYQGVYEALNQAK